VRRAKGISDIVELEGFLTAIVIGPNTLSPLAWLPKVWGGKQPSGFKDLDELNRFVALVMGFYNSIVADFDATPSKFAPTFYETKEKGKRVIIVDEWCVGFMKGMRMDATGWTPLKRERPDLLRPIKLFGTRGGWHECEAGGEVKMHATWSPRIVHAVRDIHAFLDTVAAEGPRIECSAPALRRLPATPAPLGQFWDSALVTLRDIKAVITL
jgi:uncharacterized protein